MTQRDVRRLAVLALALLCVPNLVLGVIVLLLAPGIASRAGVGDLGSFRSAWIGAAMLFAAASVLLLGLTFRRADGVGSVFAPQGLAGAQAIGCALIRVLCLRHVILGLCRVVAMLPAANLIFRSHAFSHPGPLFWVATWGLVPAASLLFFFAAPSIAKWVVGQVDSGFMWWTPALGLWGPLKRWLTR